MRSLRVEGSMARLALLGMVWACATTTDEAVETPEAGGWEARIVRDRYGVPHVFGRRDADAVFGLGYAQAEDEVWHVEDNFLRGLGRASEVWGEECWTDDVLTRALQIPRAAREEYERSTPVMRALYDAYAAGLNHYLERHPEVELAVLESFEAWHTLAFLRYKYFVQEFVGYAGLSHDEVVPEAWRSTGDDTSRLRARPWREGEFGSNTWAVGPRKSASGHPLLFMNPHVSFFGPGLYYESHLVSEEGWNFSGTGRYGFPFPYIGHNEQLGWSHTDNYLDHGDLYVETFDHPEDPRAYRHGVGYRRAEEWSEVLGVRTESGVERRELILRRTHHGPLLARHEGRPVALCLARLEEGGWYDQHFAMSKARDLSEFRSALRRNAINYMNVMYADVEGNIFYAYNGVVPRRRPEVDWRAPVEGRDPANDWQGFHSFDELPQVLNPACGFLLNTNSTPFTCSTSDAPDPAAHPAVMIGPEGDNARAQVSRQILTERERFDFEQWSEATLDTRVLRAAEWRRALDEEWRQLAPDDPLRRLEPQLERLREWDGVATLDSEAMSLLVLAEEAFDAAGGEGARLDALAAAVDRLRRDWGRAEVPWGELNRMQRRHWSRRQPFDDDAPSVAVPGGPGRLGMAFVYHARPSEGNRRRYGTHGNSYVGVVEFAPRVRARSLLFFGQSGDPDSSHHFDQAGLYGAARYKPAWFHRDEVMANAEQVRVVSRRASR